MEKLIDTLNTSVIRRVPGGIETGPNDCPGAQSLRWTRLSFVSTFVSMRGVNTPPKIRTLSFSDPPHHHSSLHHPVFCILDQAALITMPHSMILCRVRRNLTLWLCQTYCDTKHAHYVGAFEAFSNEMAWNADLHALPQR